MRKTFKIVATILMAVLALSAFACGGSDATLNEWTAPTYASVQKGGSVSVQPVIATDSEGNTYLATVAVKDPSGNDVAVAGNMFAATSEGTYTIIYTVKFGEKNYTKTSMVVVTASSDEGGQGGGGSGSGTVLSGLAVTAGSEQFFGVSGNNVTIKQAVNVSDFKTVEFPISGWTLAKGEMVSITVKNNTSGIVDVKYKVVFSDNSEAYGYPDLAVAAGGTDTYTGKTCHDETGKTPVRIELAIGGNPGTITVTGKLNGSSDGSGSQILGEMVAWDDGSHLSVEGNVVTLKSAIAESNYNGVAFPNITGWTKANGANITIKVANNTSASVKIKYKVTANTGEGYGYPDLEVAAGATGSETYATLTLDQPSATSISQIEIFIITTASSGTLTFTVSMF